MGEKLAHDCRLTVSSVSEVIYELPTSRRGKCHSGSGAECERHKEDVWVWMPVSERGRSAMKQTQKGEGREAETRRKRL